MGKSNISYLDRVVNVTPGCSGKGCLANCWAEDAHNKRHKAFLAGKKMPKQYAKPFNVVQFFPERLQEALHRKKPTVYGVSFTGDLFDEQVRFEWFKSILFQMYGKGRHHTYVLLTKHPDRMAQFFADQMHTGGLWETPLSNVWLGTTVTTQPEADEKIPELLKVPGKKWVSLEPLLGPVNLRLATPCDKNCNEYQYAECPGTSGPCVMQRHGIDLVILGCESGPKRRTPLYQWFYDVVQQCREAGVPCYVKQYPFRGKVSTNPEEWPPELRVRDLPWRKDQ